MQKFVQRCPVRIFCNECSRSTPLEPKLMFWCVCFRLGAFWNTPNQCNKCKRLGRDVLLESFATNAPDLHYWTLNSCFGVFLSIWVHLEPFRYCTKLAAKRAKLVQLMQKFVPRCHVRIFHNEHSRSTPLKLMFLCVSFRSCVFGTVLLLHETCYKTRQNGAINAKVHATMSCQNFSQRTLLIHATGP